ncbi:MAG: hypothetical protein CMO80_18925 [Verrucomicrobiales bacterium]|nr:hypothetical protein [Verrucomicrobiales bacterium]|tara:strand:+ start:1149 stop:1901 length:753 start_codon:yes stop_codon:yes gene_type:complete
MQSLSTLRTVLLLALGLSLVSNASAADKNELPPEIKKEYTHVPLKPDPRIKKLFPLGKAVEFFNGKDLRGWKVTDFAGGGEIEVDKKFKPKKGKQTAVLMIPMGEFLTGVNYTNPIPRTNYEVEMEVMKVDGNDFFCGLTFPVGETHASLILGGWGGAVVGISSLDGSDASENDTTDYIRFDTSIWYKVKLRVTPKKLEMWLDKDKLIDQELEGRRVHMRFGEIELSAPFGLATFQTTTAYRSVRVTRIK